MNFELARFNTVIFLMAVTKSLTRSILKEKGLAGDFDLSQEDQGHQCGEGMVTGA